MLEEFTYLSTAGELLSDINKCSVSPIDRGVYVVVYGKKGMPKFKDPGSGPELWRGRVVNVSVEKLVSKWVKFKDNEDQIIYIGKAGDVGMSSSLRKRIRQYISFGQGNQSSHYGGRYIWQIANHEDMAIYFKKEINPSVVERKLLNDFKLEHEGKLPFANLLNGNGKNNQ